MNERRSRLCPNCRKLISSDEPVCPYCGLSRPGSFWNRGISRWFSRLPLDPAAAIVAVNAVFYLISILLDPRALGLSANPMTFLAPSNESLFFLGATGTLPIAVYGRWWSLLTASFLHGSILHIFFNMMALRQLAPFVVEEFGFFRFAIIYVWTGVAGFLISYLAGIPFTIGASAAVCGLIGAIIYYGKSRGGFYGQQIYRQAMGWVLGLVLFGLFVPGINNWAHGGGILSGIAIAFLTGYQDRRSERLVHRFLGGASILITAAALLWALLQAAYHLLLS